MKLVRYDHEGSVRYGAIEQDHIMPLAGSIGVGFVPEADARPVALRDARLLAPVQPGKIIAVGPNYKAHLVGRPLPDRPFLWLKPPSALNGPGDPIVLPELDPPVSFNHESELAIVIGKGGRHIPAEQAADHIFGYSCINDITGGDMTDKAAFRLSAEFVDGKIFDSFAPLGPHIQTNLDPEDIRITCRVNGEVRQDHRTSDMIWSCVELVSIISRVMTLNPGDVIATGSPPGPAALRPGDHVEVEVEGIGVLANPVISERVLVAG